MTLQIIDCEQGTEEWLEARRGILTASVVGNLITPTLRVAENKTSRDVALTLASERITGHVEYVYPNADMQRGTLDEPYARDLYAEIYGPVEQIGFAVRHVDGLKLGASPDGLVGDHGGLEIKSRAPKAQLKTVLADEVPPENMAQIQCSMLVLDREWWDYCSYAGGLPLYVKRVRADPSWHNAILAALVSFEKEVVGIIQEFERASKGMPVAPRVEHFLESDMRI